MKLSLTDIWILMSRSNNEDNLFILNTKWKVQRLTNFKGVYHNDSVLWLSQNFLNFYSIWQRNKSFLKKYEDTHKYIHIEHIYAKDFTLLFIQLSYVHKLQNQSVILVLGCILALYFTFQHHHYTWCCHLEAIKHNRDILILSSKL